MYRSLEEICKEAAATGCSFWELIQKMTAGSGRLHRRNPLYSCSACTRR